VFLLNSIVEAASVILRGGMVAFPTETFYGIAVNALDEHALARLFALKDRPNEKASALLVRDLPMFQELACDVSPIARHLADTYWPGPLTIAVPARAGLPDALVVDGFVAARVSPHPLAQALVTQTGCPITATSANPSGKPPVTEIAAVQDYFHGKGPLYLLDGGTTPGGAPSTLVRVTGDVIQILRQGAIRL
jgi:L-threonylcarbamoyladenylate synthase